MRASLVLLLTLALLLSACAAPTAAPTLPPIATFPPLPTSSPSPTATIQWFPSTSTPTPLTTRVAVPTEDLRPGVGELLVQDDFTSGDEWATLRSEAGSVATGNRQLTLAVSTAGGFLSSLRATPLLQDFYLQVEASPSLCRGADTYGLILRAATDGPAYQYALNCSGQLRAEEVQGRRVQPLQDWALSAQVPAGAPARITLGVWARGGELRFFVNEVYQFSVVGVREQAGQVGFFARSEGTTAVTVSFATLSIYTLDTAAPVPPASATP